MVSHAVQRPASNQQLEICGGGETRTPAAAVIASKAGMAKSELPAGSRDRCCPLLSDVVLAPLVCHGPSTDRAVQAAAG